jgi:hypothetical protein
MRMRVGGGPSATLGDRASCQIIGPRLRSAAHTRWPSGAEALLFAYNSRSPSVAEGQFPSVAEGRSPSEVEGRLAHQHPRAKRRSPQKKNSIIIPFNFRPDKCHLTPRRICIPLRNNCRHLISSNLCTLEKNRAIN